MIFLRQSEVLLTVRPERRLVLPFFLPFDLSVIAILPAWISPLKLSSTHGELLRLYVKVLRSPQVMSTWSNNSFLWS